MRLKTLILTLVLLVSCSLFAEAGRVTLKHIQRDSEGSGGRSTGSGSRSLTGTAIEAEMDKGGIVLTFGAKMMVAIEVVDPQSGRVFQSQNSANQRTATVDISNLPEGNYELVITNALTGDAYSGEFAIE